MDKATNSKANENTDNAMNDEELIYNWDDAVKFIVDSCSLDKDIVELVLELGEEYMRKVGMIGN